jgi:hypothetical protein
MVKPETPRSRTSRQYESLASLVSYEVTEFGALLFDPYQISISFPSL